MAVALFVQSLCPPTSPAAPRPLPSDSLFMLSYCPLPCHQRPSASVWIFSISTHYPWLFGHLLGFIPCALSRPHLLGEEGHACLVWWREDREGRWLGKGETGWVLNLCFPVLRLPGWPSEKGRRREVVTGPRLDTGLGRGLKLGEGLWNDSSEKWKEGFFKALPVFCSLGYCNCFSKEFKSKIWDYRNCVPMTTPSSQDWSRCMSV